MDINQTFHSALRYHEAGDLLRAEQIYRAILKIQPANFHCYNNLGIILDARGQLDEAIAFYTKALEYNPNFSKAYFNLGNTLRKKTQYGEAMRCYEKALHIDPKFSEVYVNLGNILKDQGKIMDAETCFLQAMRIRPEWSVPHEALLLAMNYNPGNDPTDIFSRHLQYAQQFAATLYNTISPYSNDRMLSRKLRIGYVSPDFRKHSVAYFIEPVLIAHNREKFEIFCYSNTSLTDEVTRRMMTQAENWRSVLEMPDEKAADLIRSDRIDILIDLAGYTDNNRIMIFARKPAPVQASWIGYPSTTGLPTIEYKIVDYYTDPPGMTEQFYTEKLIRLPETFLCYLPEKDCSSVAELPALTHGHVTFGSFNNLAKTSYNVITSWAKILKALPDSRLIMKTFSLSDEMTRHFIRDMFQQQDIDIGRIELLPFEPSTKKHLSTYHNVDIGLDTFPYNGTTTTCEALWMGVPVVTLAGNMHVSRVGGSILSNVGLQELIAGKPEEYIEIAVALASDIRRLKFFRDTLRTEMQNSSLTNMKQFSRNLESAYQHMWENWCRSE